MKESITTLRKWNLIAGGIDPINDVIPASVGYGLEEGLQFAVSEISRLEDRIKRLENCIENAWGIIANVSGGDWDEQHPEWKQTTLDWRNNSFHPIWAEVATRRAEKAKEVK